MLSGATIINHLIDVNNVTCVIIKLLSLFRRTRMRFNEKELAQFAATFDPDKEGLLEKKGAGKGQGVCA